MNEKKSWREIDRARDKSVSKKNCINRSSFERELEDPLKKKQYLQEVEKLFKGKKGTPKHVKDLISLHESYGTPEFDKKAKKYVEKYGMPEEWSDLIMFLDVKESPELVINSLHAIKELLPQRSAIERQGLKGKLKVLEMTHSEPMVTDTIKEFLINV